MLETSNQRLRPNQQKGIHGLLQRDGQDTALHERERQVVEMQYTLVVRAWKIYYQKKLDKI